MNKKLFLLLLVILTLPIIVFGQKQIQQLLGLAAAKPANIIIETKNNLGSINHSWAAFSQGGEEAPPRLGPVAGKMKELSPHYIRLDHIYDSNQVVSKRNNGYVYDFSVLDKVVDDILSMGALPFFSLTYMPSDFTSSGSIIDKPADWNDWKNLVKATVEHYSGKDQRNLKDIYYEVWNEPELPQFGDWKIGGDKDYRQLYFYSAAGAREAANVNKFYLGGPSVGSYYSTWVKDFLSYVAQNNLQLDFYSWHRYTKRPNEYVSDSQKIRNQLSSFAGYAGIPLLLTEWGIDSENTLINNTNTAASHAIYSIAQASNINLFFNFEVKDGPPPTGGNWGLLFHESNQQTPLSPKPKFKAFAELAKMKGNKISLTGAGTYVSGIAAESTNSIRVILANYDPSGKNIENVPVTFTGLSPGVYNLKYQYSLDDRSGYYEMPTTSGSLSRSFLMPANSIVSLELTRSANIATFISGQSGQATDKALVLKNAENPLSFSSPEFHLLPVGSIKFDINPLWGNRDDRSFYILESSFETIETVADKLSLSKQKTGGGNYLVFSISQNQKAYTLEIPITQWDLDNWHSLEMGWDQDGFWFLADGEKVQNTVPLDIRNGKQITFSPVDIAIDNLKIVVGKGELIERSFDGRVDK